MTPQTEQPSKEIEKIYDNSFPRLKKAWRYLVKARECAGQKDLYFMILLLQNEMNEKGAYTFKDLTP